MLRRGGRGHSSPSAALITCLAVPRRLTGASGVCPRCSTSFLTARQVANKNLALGTGGSALTARPRGWRLRRAPRDTPSPRQGPQTATPSPVAALRPHAVGPQGKGGAGPGGGGRASGLVAGMGPTGGNGGTAAGQAHLLPGPGLLPVPLPVLDPVPVPVLDPLPAPLPVPSRSWSRCRSRPGPLSPAGSGAEAPAPPPREFPSLTDRRLSQSERAAAYKRAGCGGPGQCAL